MDLSEKIYNAGIVGAGGAGFPTHVKANSDVEVVIANGAECEPLIHKDVEIMKNFPSEIIRGVELMIESTGASKAYFGIKSKNTLAVEAIENACANTIIDMTKLGDFYPAGDEYELVYHSTGRLIPPHGIPLNVGCVVNNVETLYNIAKADEGIPLTEKFITVTGLVKTPSSFFVPIGTSFRKAIEFAGGLTSDKVAVFISGLMMGELTFDLDRPITKTTGGLIILPNTHYLVTRNNTTLEQQNRIGKSACDQCSYCTEFCPRYLLGYDVQPHKVMRSLEFSKSGTDYWNQFADLCCACGLCTLYACPEDLFPREACVQSKGIMKQNNFKYEQPRDVKVHPIKSGRQVPLKQLRKKLDVEKYEQPTPYVEINPDVDYVKIMLNQHVGAVAKPLITEGIGVKKGDLIAAVEKDQLGANIHASITGIVEKVTNDFITLRKGE